MKAGLFYRLLAPANNKHDYYKQNYNGNHNSASLKSFLCADT